MMKSVSDYFARLTAAVGDGWARFWFTPSDPATVSALRLLTGLVVVYLHATLSLDLMTFFGPAGLLPVFEIAPLEGNTFSYLNYASSPAELWSLHLLGLVALVLFAAGLWTRITTVLALVVFLSVVHRAPMITGRTDVVVAMVLLYLCIAPCGRRFSLDAWLAARKNKARAAAPLAPSTTATIAMRLIQVHLCLLIAMMAFSQLSGDVWWSGLGMWFLITRQESRLIDFTWLESSPFAVDLWTHLVIGFEFLFPILIWVRMLRPLLLGLGLVVWTSLALVTGDITFSLMLVIAGLAFVSPESILAFAHRGPRVAVSAG
jgi:hypothetical protein